MVEAIGPYPVGCLTRFVITVLSTFQESGPDSTRQCLVRVARAGGALAESTYEFLVEHTGHVFGLLRVASRGRIVPISGAYSSDGAPPSSSPNGSASLIAPSIAGDKGAVVGPHDQ